MLKYRCEYSYQKNDSSSSNKLGTDGPEWTGSFVEQRSDTVRQENLAPRLPPVHDTKPYGQSRVRGKSGGCTIGNEPLAETKHSQIIAQRRLDSTTIDEGRCIFERRMCAFSGKVVLGPQEKVGTLAKFLRCISGNSIIIPSVTRKRATISDGRCMLSSSTGPSDWESHPSQKHASASHILSAKAYQAPVKAPTSTEALLIAIVGLQQVLLVTCCRDKSCR